MSIYDWDSGKRENQLHYTYRRYDLEPNDEQHAEALATAVSYSLKIEEILVLVGLLSIGENSKGAYYYKSSK